jgi:hypothetical protein
LRSAQRFFIANDNRLLPSGVSPPRLLAFNADGRGVATLVFLAARGEFAPSNAAMARLSLSLSCFKSATILCKSKIHSFLLICQLNVACYFVLPQHVGCRSALRRSPAHAGIHLSRNRRKSKTGWWERGEFELPVSIAEQPDDNVMGSGPQTKCRDRPRLKRLVGLSGRQHSKETVCEVKCGRST